MGKSKAQKKAARAAKTAAARAGSTGGANANTPAGSPAKNQKNKTNFDPNSLLSFRVGGSSDIDGASRRPPSNTMQWHANGKQDASSRSRKAGRPPAEYVNPDLRNVGSIRTNAVRSQSADPHYFLRSSSGAGPCDIPISSWMEQYGWPSREHPDTVDEREATSRTSGDLASNNPAVKNGNNTTTGNSITTGNSTANGSTNNTDSNSKPQSKTRFSTSTMRAQRYDMYVRLGYELDKDFNPPSKFDVV
jgi:hypothetical protein